MRMELQLGLCARESSEGSKLHGTLILSPEIAKHCAETAVVEASCAQGGRARKGHRSCCYRTRQRSRNTSELAPSAKNGTRPRCNAVRANGKSSTGGCASTPCTVPHSTQ